MVDVVWSSFWGLGLVVRASELSVLCSWLREHDSWLKFMVHDLRYSVQD